MSDGTRRARVAGMRTLVLVERPLPVACNSVCLALLLGHKARDLLLRLAHRLAQLLIDVPHHVHLRGRAGRQSSGRSVLGAAPVVHHGVASSSSGYCSSGLAGVNITCFALEQN